MPRRAAPRRAASASALIDYILRRFHECHREDVPELIRLARRVEEMYSDRPDCPTGVADYLEGMFEDLLSHMMKEEQALFPMLLEGSDRMAQSPIAVMRSEHDQHGEALAQLESLTNDMSEPADACNTWRALYVGLRQLREELMQHIHLENNILFLNAERLN